MYLRMLNFGNWKVRKYSLQTHAGSNICKRKCKKEQKSSGMTWDHGDSFRKRWAGYIRWSLCLRYVMLWWHRTKQSNIIERFNHIEYIVCLRFRGAIRTTPTAIMQPLLGFPPVDIVVGEWDFKLNLKLRQWNLWTHCKFDLCIILVDATLQKPLLYTAVHFSTTKLLRAHPTYNMMQKTFLCMTYPLHWSKSSKSTDSVVFCEDLQLNLSLSVPL